jgi:hypothetical protein
MPNPNNQTDLLDDRMIARLEQANARAYEEFARANERVLKPDQDSTRHPESAVMRQSPSSSRPVRSKWFATMQKSSHSSTRRSRKWHANSSWSLV